MSKSRSSNGSTQNNSSEQSNVQKAAQLAQTIAADFGKMFDLLGCEKRINVFQENNFITLWDELNNIKNELISRTDGRPKAFDLSSYCQGQEEYCRSTEALKELEEERLDLKTWARCENPGYDTIACIADKELNREHLELLRKWIDDVILWHEKNPKRRTK